VLAAIIGELEQLILSLTCSTGDVGVSEQRVAMMYGRLEWRAYTSLVREAALSLEKRGLIVTSEGGTHFRSP
jgi:hypothetical protein